MEPLKASGGLWETTSTDANQFKASGYLDTGKLGQAVSMYGNAAGTAGSTLTFNRGALISGNNYEHINTNQGTISFWFKPSWNGNDAYAHSFFDPRTGYVPYIVKWAGGNIGVNWAAGGFNVAASTTSVTAGNWYHLVVRWNSAYSISGSNYVCITLNGTETCGQTSSFTAGAPGRSEMRIGSDYLGTSPAQSLIDDFAIYDRVLSTTEISSLYNSGTGNEAGYVADSSLKFYAKLDGSGTLQPVTHNGGASTSKMTRTSAELAGGTNLIADGNMEVSGTDSWTVSYPAGGSGSKTTTGVLFDTQSLTCTDDGPNYCYFSQNIATTNGASYHLTLWLKDNNYPRVTIISGATTLINSYVYVSGIWSKYETDFVAAGTSTTVKVGTTNIGVETLYLDNVSVVPNLVSNGGMEGQYASTGSALYSATSAQVQSGGSNPYTYTETGKFATGLAGLIATDGANFGYITASTADSVTVDFTGGNGTIATGTAFDVKNAIASGWDKFFGAGVSIKDASVLHSGSASQKFLHDATTGAGGIRQINALTIDNNAYYLVSFWYKTDSGVGGSSFYYSLNGGASGNALPESTSWVKFARVVPGSAFSSGLSGYSNKLAFYLNYTNAPNKSWWVDDVSVTPLDNVSTSFNSWASVSDSSALGNSLSVQGSATGVQSLAAGVRNSAYTFDGSTGYLRQATIATNIGTLGYSGNTLADDGQTFTSYKTSTGNAAYMIVVTNSDNTTSWGYIGNNSEATTSVTVYTTIARATQGWNGTAVSGKTPVGYEIRKTDFQLTSSFTIGTWVNLQSDPVAYLITKRSLPGTVNGGDSSYGLTYSSGAFSFSDRAGEAGASYTMTTDNNWHFVVGTYDGVTTKIYVDGVKGIDANQIATIDSWGSLSIGYDPAVSGGRNLAGSIDEPFVTAEALSASQILDMYNKGLGALNHATKSDQKLQGTTNTVQAVAASSDGSTIYAGTDTAPNGI